MTTRPTRQNHLEPVGSPSRLEQRRRRGEQVSQPTAVSLAPAPMGRVPIEQGPTLTVAEAAQLLGVSTWLVQQQVARGTLPSVRLGRRILISRARLLTWLDTGQ